MMTADSGEVYLDGRRIDHLPPWTRAHLGLGRTFQITRLFGEMTVLENLVAPLREFTAGQLNRGAISGEEAAQRRRAARPGGHDRLPGPARLRPQLRSAQTGGAGPGAGPRAARDPPGRTGRGDQPHPGRAPGRADTRAQRRGQDLPHRGAQHALCHGTVQSGAGPGSGHHHLPGVPGSTCSRTGACSKPIWATTSCSSPRASAMLELKDLTAGYGGGSRSSRRGPQGRAGIDHLYRGPQRRRQVHGVSGGQRPDRDHGRLDTGGRHAHRGPELPPRSSRPGVAQVPQSNGLFPALTVRENVLMGAYLIRRQRALVKERYEHVAGSVSGGARAGRRQGRQPLRRTAAHGRVRPGPHAGTEAGAPRRALGGARPQGPGSGAGGHHHHASRPARPS